MIALVAATAAGRARARHLAAALPGARLLPGRPREALGSAFAEADAVVLFLATGAAVRLLSPLLSDKRRDPGVVCVDEAARFAVALTGGHEGGANELAERVAAALGATPVVTTASDAAGIPALDSLGSELGFRLEPGGDVAAVGAAILSGEPVALVSDRRWPLPPLPPNVVGPRPAVDPPGGGRGRRRPAASIVIADRLAPPPRAAPGHRRPAASLVIADRLAPPPRPSVVYRPPSLVLGIGCSRGASSAEVLELVDASLAAAGLAPASVAAVASVEAKRDEAGLLDAAAERGWPLRLHAADALARVPVPNPSEVVRRAVGTPSVAEAAALREAAAPARIESLAAPPELVVEKRASAMATVAVARRPVRGRLTLVGLGPGDDALIPPLARNALARSQVVVGLGRYVDSVRHLLRPGTEVEPYGLGEEVERCRRAVERASAGASVALVSSGDAGVYAMASPALELGGLASVDVEVVPGVTAANAAAALAGSPLGHDHCAISLSDLLTPWPAIERRLRAAAAGDFVVSLYNPRSRARDWQLDAARSILLGERPPDTPVAVVADAYRDGQRVELTTLAGLDADTVSMTTTVIVGSSRTRLVEGRMVTPRGYAG